MSIIINPKKTLKILLSIISVLVVLSLISHYYEVTTGNHRYLANMFNLDWEGNFPTWFSSMNLLLCSILLFIIALYKRKTVAPFRYHWAFLSLIFFVLSLDEILILHEQTIGPLRSFFNSGGFFYFAWVILALIFLPLLALAYLKFILDLPSKLKKMFMISAGIYLAGALGMELVNGYIFDKFGRDTYLYATSTDFEESLELIGIAFFTYTLLSYIEVTIKDFRFIINSEQVIISDNSPKSTATEKIEYSQIK